MMSSQASGGRCEAAVTDNPSSYTTFVQSSLSSTVSSVAKARKPLLKRIFNTVINAWYTFSDWLMAWTPFCLVVSYFIVCTAIFVMCSTTAITVFYYFYMVANLYIAVVAVIESFLGMSPVRQAQVAAEAEVVRMAGAHDRIVDRLDEPVVVPVGRTGLQAAAHLPQLMQ